MIIGLTGKNGSGKGVVAEYLQKAGYIYYSLSDMIREEIKKTDQEVNRQNLIAMGRKLREEGGPSVLADKVFDLLDIDKNYIVDSVRNPFEVRALKRRKDFYLFCVEADQKVRFERTKERARENDPVDFDVFVTLEEKELNSTDPAAQQLVATAALADYVIDNSTTVEDVHQKTKDLLLELVKKNTRPDWDTYFMNIAQNVSLRSNCLKRKVAAIIVKDKRIISTGYNGTPRGVKNCSDGGCPRCASFAPSGTGLHDCLCSHAEENAIVQAAYHGVSIKDSTLYCTFSPCLTCTKMILNSGINEVVYNANYPLGDVALRLIEEAGLQLRKM
jgi:dCMP deaminase